MAVLLSRMRKTRGSFGRYTVTMAHLSQIRCYTAVTRVLQAPACRYTHAGSDACRVGSRPPWGLFQIVKSQPLDSRENPELRGKEQIWNILSKNASEIFPQIGDVACAGVNSRDGAGVARMASCGSR